MFEVKGRLCLLLVALNTSLSAFAIDGTITFNGMLVSSTCTPTVTGGSVSAASKGNATVTLPAVNISALSAATQTAGLTGFAIKLDGGTDEKTDGCVAGTDNAKIARPYFEPEAAKINAQGRVINTSGAATNVDIEILNDNQKPINLSEDSNKQLSSAATVSNNAHTYQYFARYYATNKTTPGSIVGSVDYSIIYK